jgi:hypothetical protein
VTVPVQVQRRMALTWMWLSVVLLLIVVLSSGCASHTVDPDRTFHYAALQLDPSSGLLVLERSSLEQGEDHGLLIEGDRKVCAEIGAKEHEHRCITLGQLRTWVRAGAPPPR